MKNRCLFFALLIFLSFAVIPNGAAYDFPTREQLTTYFQDDSDDPLVPAEVWDELPPWHTDRLRQYQGVPSIAAISDKILWAAWFTGGITENRDNFVVMSISRDGGDTWSPPFNGIHTKGIVRTFDPMLWLDPEKRLWIFWSQGQEKRINPLDNSWFRDTRCGIWAMTCSEPEKGRSARWTSPRRISDGLVTGKPIVDSTGRYLLPVCAFRDPSPFPIDARFFSATVLVSEDQGKTFAFLGGSVVPDKDAAHEEHEIVEKRDGSLWTLCRTRYGVGEASSTDGGKTWTPMAPPPLMKNTISRLVFCRLNSGSLLLVKNGPLDKDVGRARLTAFLSQDEGATWSRGLVIDSRNNVSYPVATQSPDGTIYVISDFERWSEKEICLARFTEEDLLAGEIISPRGKLGIIVNKATGKTPPKESFLSRNRKMAFDPNKDGRKLSWDDTFKVDSGKYECLPLRDGEQIFTDRFYEFNTTLPKELKGKRFIRGSYEGTEILCETDGIIHIYAPSEKRNPKGIAGELENAGFEKVALPEIMLFCDHLQYIATLYQKKVSKGERIRIASWGVIIL